MTDEDAFKSAQERAQKLPRRPSNDELLALYALYKQGTLGDASGKRPGMFDVKGRTKFDAWKKQTGKAEEQARTEYVELVERLEKKYG